MVAWVSEEAEREFWESRKPLALTREWAEKRLASPHALLISVLQRVLVTIPPNVVLPDIIGSIASLNLFAAITAATAGGKDRALDVARGAVVVENGMPYRECYPGSGEALVDLFAHSVGQKYKQTVVDHDCVLLRASEVDALTALGS
jgi:hypothetical protein